MREPDYRGLSTLVIAASASVGIFVITPLALAILNRGIGEVGGDVLIALGGALVGSMATYMGMKIRESDNGREGTNPRPEQPPDAGADQADERGLRRATAQDQ